MVPGLAELRRLQSELTYKSPQPKTHTIIAIIAPIASHTLMGIFFWFAIYVFLPIPLAKKPARKSKGAIIAPSHHEPACLA